jgi:sortase (surface protein transpeptidase)
MKESVPTSISIPAIHVKSKLVKLGVNKDHTVQVPQPGPDYNKAGWYKYSPTPGQRGPAVILGHIDSAKDGPSVFFHLGDLHHGDKVKVSRKNGSTAVFTIDKVKEYPKTAFPTKKVYGDTPKSTLRLVTCGGKFDDQKKSYQDNIVAFGHLTGSKT